MARILVAEDSQTHTQVIRSILQSADHSVECVADGRQALDHLVATECDVLVTDLNMPVLDGCRLVEQLTRNRPELPVIVVTARGSESLAVDALAIGACDFVPKHSMNRLLCDVVRNALAYREADRRASSVRGRLRSPEFYFKLDSDPGSILPVTEYLVATMASARCGDANVRYRTATAVGSAIFNAIQYGNLQLDDRAVDRQLEGESDPPPAGRSDLAVRVKVSIVDSDTRVSVAHEGEGSITRTSPAPGTPESFEVEQCRGLMLMTSFMDDVMFNSRRTEVTMVKRHDAEADC